MIHALRKKDLITEKEYQYLRNEVKRKKVPTEYDDSSKNETFYTRSQRINSGMVERATLEGRAKEEIEEQLVEEAIAEMYRAREFKPVTPKSKGILNRIVEFFKSMGQAMRVSGYRDSSEIFADIERGKVGARERGQIRTLQELDKISMAREQGIVGGLGITPSTVPDDIATEEDKPVTPDVEAEFGEGVIITPDISFEDVQADKDPITGVELALGAGQRGGIYDREALTSEEAALDAKEVQAQFPGIGEDAKSLDLLEWMSKSGPSEAYRVIAKRLLIQQKRIEKVGGTKLYVRVVSEGNQRLPIRGHKGYDFERWGGISYAPFIYEGEKRQQIYLKATNFGSSFEVLLHELVHQTTQAFTRNAAFSSDERVQTFNSELEKIRKVLIKQIEDETGSKGRKGRYGYENASASTQLGQYVVYGAANIDELLAEGLTNKKFQDYLEKIPYTVKGKKSLWNKFTESIRKLLNLPAKHDSALSAFLTQASYASDINVGTIKSVYGTGALDAPPIGAPLFSRQSLESELSDLRRELYDAQSLESADRGYVDVEAGNRNMRRVQDIRNKIERLEAELKQPVTPEQLPLFSRQSKTPSIKELPGEVSEYGVNYNITDAELQYAVEALEMSRKSGTRENPGQLNTTIVEIFENNPNLLEASKNFLRKFTNKKGNLIVYRALNIPASMRIKNYGQLSQDIYASTTLDHREAINIARAVEQQTSRDILSLRTGEVTKGNEAQSEILRFEVPMDRVQAYVPSLIVAARDKLINSEELSLIDAGVESEMDEDFNPDEYNDYTREQYIEEYENDLDNYIDEAEVLVDLRGIKPTYQYTPGSGLTGREPSITRDIPLFSRARRFTGEANTQEKIALQKSTEIIEDFVKKTPRGEIPLYNTNASDVALKAAYDYINDPSAPTINELPNYSKVEKEIPEDLQGVVNRGGYVAPRKPWYERLISDASDPVTNIRKFFKDTRQNYIDKLDKVEKKLIQGSEEFEEVRLLNNIADTSAIASLRMADKARGIFQGMLTKGFAADVIEGEPALTNVQDLEIDTVYNPYIDGNTGTGGLLQITAPLFSDPLVDLEGIFGTYAKLKRVQGFQKQNRQVESPFTQQDLEFINNIEANYQVVVEVYNNYQKWNNKLVDFAQAKGLLNEAQATKWREESTYYPFYRDMVEEEGITAPRIGGGSLPNNPLNLKLKGSEAEINVSPLEAIARNSLSILTASMKNDGTLKLIESLEAMGEAEYITPQELKNKQGAKTIFVFENGFKKHYNIEDPDLFHGIRALGGAEVGFITKMLAMPATLLRDTVTRDPGFIAVNLLRDTLSATVTSGVNLSAPGTGGDGFVPMIDTIKNMFGDMSDLEKFGVIGGYDFANDEGDVVDYMARIRRQQGLTANNGMSAEKAFFYVWDGLGGLTTKSDGATRKGVFDAVYKRMKNTIDERTGEVYTDAAAQSEAAFQSLEVINFGRRGLSPMFRVITSAIPFLNARIQGLDLIYRSAFGTYSAQDKLQEGETLNELKNRIMRRTLLRGGTIMASTLIYYLLVSDTEEYKEAKREIRDDNWLIPTPFDYTLKVPIPFEIGMMFKALPERFIDLILGEKVLGLKESVEKDPIESIRRQLGTSANIPFLSGDISIQALKPIFEATINRNSFTGQEIVPYYKLKREPGYQASPQTNELARVIGEALNISPTKIEHVINGYTGTLGGYVLDIVDSLTRTATGSPYIPNNIFSNPTNFAQYPLIKRLVVDNKKMGGLQQQFYELRGEVDRAVTTMNSLKKERRFDELRAYKSDVKGLMNVKGRVRAMERYLDNWRKKRDRLMRRTDISVMVKAEMLQDLEAERDKRLAFIPELRKKANVPILQGGL